VLQVSRATANDPDKRKRSQPHREQGNRAISLHKAGHYQEAREAYLEELRVNPNDFDVLRNYGVLLYQTGDYKEAVEVLKRATHANRTDSSLFSNLGVALKATGDAVDALDAYERSIRLDPKNVNAHYCKGNLLAELGRYQDAISAYECALLSEPANSRVLNNLGLAFLELKNLRDSENCFTRAIESFPRYAEAYFNRATVRSVLGDFEAAVEDYRETLSINPLFLEAHNNLGNLYRDQRRYCEALQCFERLLELSPQNPAGLNNKASTLMCLGRFEDARPLVDKIIKDEPGNADAWDNKAASVLALEGDPQRALACYQEALFRDPQNARIRWNKSLIDLLLGNEEEGLRGYESRWDFDGFVKRNPITVFGPSWDGNTGRLNGKRLFVYGEQGVGDFIQFSRYISLLLPHGPKVTVRTPPSLVTLLDPHLVGVSITTEWPVEGSYDLHCPLMSLPYLLGADARTVLDGSPWLGALVDKRAEWGDRLNQSSGSLLRVGVAWAGSVGHANDKNRTLALRQFMKCLPNEVEVHSLQREYRDDDLELMRSLGVHDHSAFLADYSDTAALIAELDLVVSVDTSVVHLSGSMGKECWVLLPFLPDWRWGLGSVETRWYRSVKLFRQTSMGDWSPALASIKRGLSHRLELASRDSCRYTRTQESLIAGLFSSQIEQMLQSQKATEARALCEQRLGSDPDDVEALFMLSKIFFTALGDPLAAISTLQRALQLTPQHVGALNNLGVFQQSVGKLLDAKDSFTRALEVEPNHVEALFNRGRILVGMGEEIRGLEDLDRLLSLRPDYAAAYAERALAYRRQKRLGDAISSAMHGLAVDATQAQCHNVVGICLLDLNRVEEAINYFGNAISINPRLPDVLSNRGGAYARLNRVNDAILDYRAALEFAPENPEINFNLSLMLLLSGQYQEGWQRYEYRLKTFEMALQRLHKSPRLTSTDKGNLEGRRVLITTEQGLGDNIQFCRYARILKELGAKVSIEAPLSLAGLLGSAPWIDNVQTRVTREAPYDFHCELMSLPHILGLQSDAIDVPVPYLHVPDGAENKWRSVLPPANGRKRIGIVWSGNPKQRNDAFRSIPLEVFLRGLPAEHEYVSLQKVIKLEERELFSRTPILDFSEKIDDFTDTAALCNCMDLVVSVDTSVAHLSGALGRPTWIMLPYAPDWRYMLGREDVSWYPTARLFRQTQPGNWADILSLLRSELASLSSGVAASN
jgi:tetratricopeptide (TPR) repeat protein